MTLKTRCVVPSRAVVFWEIWCPHCRREVPKLEEMSAQYKGKMDIVGLTRLTRDKSPEEVDAFLKENKVTYPVAKENGKVAQHWRSECH